MIRRNIRYFNPDILVIAGDLTRWFNPRPTLEHIAGFSINTLFVRGNTDGRQVDRILPDYPSILSPHMTRLKIGEHSFVGLNGTIPIPFRSQITLAERWSRKMEQLLDPATILVAHPPPRGTLDSVFFNLHAGCPQIRETILKQTPLLYICGHIHESAGLCQLGNTLVVNCSIGHKGEGALIELEQNRIQKAEMLHTG